MMKLCACGVYTIDDEHSNYVRDNGDGTSTPFCPVWTCEKVKEHRHMRRVPFFDDPHANELED
jgi:hypothetical protein